ncbi:glycosyltransferase family 2 protein [Lacticaseibacillus pantheris]|jgi:glycosyltransferase involved in cell wall biosynthesis|uniref:glycosyltransferase family 2 protein n=1 Tax=Lacticaseibacillus pantheris TaxID=171523 RepID=UPI0026590C71|nr:glycosyltransferase family 2 protein [Lacticaseibacillus pantheris]WKF84759.1 glycosyltransferase family 2 protein [Lacticaseibacillus pantheris]
MTDFAAIIPCHNEEENVPLIYDALQETFAQLPEYHLVTWFINDGSTDKTLMAINLLQSKDQDVHFIDMSRAFGKEAGMFAGLSNAKADLYCILDADLQDPPSMIPEMLAGIDEGYDVVGAARTNRDGEPPIRSFFANMFYKIINAVSSTPIIPGARDFRVMTKQVVEAVLSLSESQRFSKGLFSWVGFKTKYLPYKNVERQHGKTSWNFMSLLNYSIDGLVDYSDAPLTVVSGIGLISFIGATIALIFIVVRAAIYGDPTSGWPSMVSIMLMIGGLQLLAIGIVGRYVGRIFLEVKDRPIYIARKIK